MKSARNQARAILDLFAPILAEKERRIANLTRGLEESTETNVKLGMTWQAAAEKAESRALAAEAALAGERERCAKIAESTDNLHLYKREELTSDFGQPRFDVARKIAAAIRAQP